MSEPAGVSNGVLRDPEAFIWQLFGRRPGDYAGRKSEKEGADWYRVFKSCGIPAGLPPGQVPTYDATFYGVKQQIGAAGPRGVLFLPTNAPDGNGYYAHEILLLMDDHADADILRWAWRDVGAEKGQPPYTPLTPTGNGGGDNGGGNSDDYHAELGVMFEAMVAPIVARETQALQDEVAALSARVQALEQGGGSQPSMPKKIALKDARGKYVCADQGAGDQVPLLANRDARGDWETFDLEVVE